MAAADPALPIFPLKRMRLHLEDDACFSDEMEGSLPSISSSHEEKSDGDLLEEELLASGYVTEANLRLPDLEDPISVSSDEEMEDLVPTSSSDNGNDVLK